MNTKKYIESYIKIRNKKGRIVNFKLNSPQQRLYDVIKKQKQKKRVRNSYEYISNKKSSINKY